MSYQPQRKAKRGEAAQFLLDNCQPGHNDCVEWPFSLNPGGYGRIFFNGVNTQASRAALLTVKGEPPEPGMDAAHTCNNRKCINAAHLYWATRQENLLDREECGTVNRGTSNGNTKLTDDQVIEIYQSHETRRALSERFGVSMGYVTEIWQGKKRAWLTGGRRHAA